MENNAEDTFFQELESHLKTTIPTFLKNILKFNGFANQVSFQLLSDTDLDQLEAFVREEFKDLIEEDEYEKYFGPFHKKPEKFRFLFGHRRLLQAAKDALEKANRQAQKLTNKSQASTSNIVRLETSSTSTSMETTSMTEHVKTCRSLIIKWLKSLAATNKKKIIVERMDGFMEHMSDINIECSPGNNNGVECSILCYICKKKVKGNQIRRNEKCHWSLSNFYSHFSKHLECSLDKDGNQSNKNINNESAGSSRIQQSILSFCKEMPSTSNQSSTQLFQSSDVNLSDEIINTVDTGEGTTDDERTRYQTKTSINNKRRVIESSASDTESDSENGKQNLLLATTLDFDSSKVSDLNSSKSAQKMGSATKWSSDKYSRSSRNQRKREKVINQPVITNFFKPVDEISMLIQQNMELRQQL